MASPPEEALGEPLLTADEEEPAGMPVSWEALPDVVRRKLCQDGKPLTPVLLWNMFMSDDEVCSFVESAGFVAVSVEWLRYSHVLCELWREAEHRAYLATRGLSSQLGAHCRAASGMQVQPPVAVVMTQETLLASAAVKRQLHWPCRLAKRRALARNEGGRAQAEADELQRWRYKLAGILRQCGFPICQQAMFVANSDRLLETAAGNTRASTLRQRIREWLKFSAWCFAVKGVYYDPNPGVLVDYLEELYLQPCARTKLKAVLSAVSLVEKAGAVPSENRLSLSRSALVTVDTRTAELEQGAPETRRAAPLPLIMVASLELAVMDSSLPRYWRAFAWVRLFKVWTSSRTDDLLGVLPSSMHLGSRGLKGVFDRTKTSGAGRRVRWLPFFISRGAWVVEQEWLETGFAIWASDGFSFERDYLVPRPSENFDSCRPILASYPDQATLSKRLCMMLKVPVLRDAVWHRSEMLLFLDMDWLTLLSEHSERNFTSSVASAAGVDRERRAYLGRWHVVEASDEYLRTAWQVVTGLQRLVVATLCQASSDLVDFGLDALDQRLQDRGVPKENRDLLQGSWAMPPEWAAWRREFLDSAPVQEAAPPVPVRPPPEPGFAYFVTVLGKRRLRRLHRRSGCGTQPEKVQCVEFFESLKGVQFDSECRHCFPSERDPPEEEASSLSSSTDSSSSESSEEGG